MKVGMQPEDLLHLVRNAKATLRYIHSKGVVHSDLGEMKKYSICPRHQKSRYYRYWSMEGSLSMWISFIPYMAWRYKSGSYSEFVDYVKNQNHEYHDDPLTLTILKEILELYK